MIIIRIKKYNKLFPNMLTLMVISHVIYYWLVFNGTYNTVLPLVILALFSAIAGYGASTIFYNTQKRKIPTVSFQMEEIDYKKLSYLGIWFIVIGTIAHLGFYGTNINALASYADGYSVGRGNGYITVFFNFLILGMILIEYVIKYSKAKISLIFFNRLMILIYTTSYLLLFMKRRQVLLLFVCLLVIHFNKIHFSKKSMLYFGIILAIVALTIFGKIRGYYETYGFDNIGGYINNNFSIDWITISEMEGKYISRTLNDVYGYVGVQGNNPYILIGVIFCMVPRKLFGGFKPLSFPDWYTYTFHFSDYLKGTGYAGSLVAELYLIGGIAILIIGYFIIGSICWKMQKNVNKSYKNNLSISIVNAIFVYTIVFLPRLDLASLFIDFMFLYLPIILTFKFCRKKIKKERKFYSNYLVRSRIPTT